MLKVILWIGLDGNLCLKQLLYNGKNNGNNTSSGDFELATLCEICFSNLAARLELVEGVGGGRLQLIDVVALPPWWTGGCDLDGWYFHYLFLITDILSFHLINDILYYYFISSMMFYYFIWSMSFYYFISSMILSLSIPPSPAPQQQWPEPPQQARPPEQEWQPRIRISPESESAQNQNQPRIRLSPESESTQNQNQPRIKISSESESAQNQQLRISCP